MRNKSLASLLILSAAVIISACSEGGCVDTVLDPCNPAPTLSVTTTTLDDGAELLDYSTPSLAATGGTGTYAWGLAAASGLLPAGLTLSPSGVISGTPTLAGSYSFTVEVTSGTQTDQQALSIDVEVGCRIDDCTGLQGLWKLDESPLADGATTTDESSFSRTSTLVTAEGAVDKSIVGQLGRAVDLDGADDHVTVAEDAGLDFDSDFTLMAWINPTALPAAYQALISKNATPNRPASLWLFGGVVEVWFTPSSQQAVSAGTVVVGSWQHVATTFDESADEIRIYIDGVLDVTVGGVTDVPDVNDEPLTLGQRGDATFFFNGAMDEVMVWDRALTDQEVEDIYERTN